MLHRTLVLVLFLFSACASFYTKDLEPSLELVPESFSFSGIMQCSDSSHANWWYEFEDPILQDLIRSALTNNRDLRQAAERVKQAQARVTIAKSNRLPQLSLVSESRRQNRSFLVGPNQAGTDQSSLIGTTFNNFSNQLSLSWEPDLWGRLSSGQKLSEYSSYEQQQLYRAAALSLIAQVISAYTELVDTRYRRKLVTTKLDLVQRLQEQDQQRYISGVIGHREHEQTQAQLLQLEQIQAQLQMAEQLACTNLEILLADYPDCNIESSSGVFVVKQEIPFSMPITVVRRRADILAAETKVYAGNESIKEGLALLYPDVSLNASGGSLTRNIEDVFNSDFSIWSLAARIVQPLFTGGKLMAGINERVSVAESAINNYEQTLLTAFKEIEDALRSDYLTQKRFNYILNRKDLLIERDIRLDRLYQEGLVNLKTLVTDRLNLINVKEEQSVVWKDRVQARARLYLALGGGFEVQKNLEDTLSLSTLDSHLYCGVV